MHVSSERGWEGDRDIEFGMECSGGCVREIHLVTEWKRGCVVERVRD